MVEQLTLAINTDECDQDSLPTRLVDMTFLANRVKAKPVELVIGLEPTTF